jgi:peptidoglycan-N-acetylglucosamine deacetylase
VALPFQPGEKDRLERAAHGDPIGPQPGSPACRHPFGTVSPGLLGGAFFSPFVFFLPVISRGADGREGIALTFDDGPFPDSTPVLLELLARYRLPATFFVVGERAAVHPDLIAAILAQGHTIGNHSFSHDNLLMLRACDRVEADIRQTQEILANSGVRPLFFRPPIGVISPRLAPALASLNLQAMTFSCRIFDRGNRNVHDLAARVVRKSRPGDILLLHDNPPQSEEDRVYWKKELHCLFERLAMENRIVPLADLIEQPVMLPVNSNIGLRRV